jgi:hypothetical protein
MKLYHFTSLGGILGAAALADVQRLWADSAAPDEVRARPGPDSILRAGLKPNKNGEYDHIGMPPSVWFTTNPDMTNEFITGNTLDRGAYRITVAIPQNDRRLVHWPAYYSKASGRDFVIGHEDEATAIRLAKECFGFYVYFGTVPLSRIRLVEDMRIDELAAAA